MNRLSTQLCVSIAAGILLLAACINHPSTGTVAATASGLPQDADSICGISSDSFNAWFRSGQPTEDGAVTPANSVAFPHNDNCDFYQWAERMFLWITSPDTSGGKERPRVLESPIFYTVVPRGDTDYLQAHHPGEPLEAVSVLHKTGPNRLPVYTDHKGHLYEVLFHPPTEKPRILNGKAIIKPTSFSHPEQIVHAFRTSAGMKFFFYDGSAVTSALDQATGDALMAQTRSLVYYITFVNDMYAYYRTMVSVDHITNDTFPTTAKERDEIVRFAASIRYPAPVRPDALTMELKTSWVEADSLPGGADKYITIKAWVTKYTFYGDTLRIPNGRRLTKLALVGIHIVGSAAHHPEMIWATFEHIHNTPDSTYRYEDSTKNSKTVIMNSSADWLFSARGGAPFNISHIKDSLGYDTLQRVYPYTISPSNTLREFPFGAIYGQQPNAQDATDAQSNAEIIYINNSVINKIPGNDVRKNYHLIGATWTSGGAAPNGIVYHLDSTTSDTAAGVSIGTSALANSTMETYFQATTNSCFSCHSSCKDLQCQLAPEAISHIFGNMRPLYIVPK